MKNIIIILSVAVAGTVLVILFFKAIDFNFGEGGGIAMRASSGEIFASLENKYLINKY